MHPNKSIFSIFTVFQCFSCCINKLQNSICNSISFYSENSMANVKMTQLRNVKGNVMFRISSINFIKQYLFQVHGQNTL